MDGTGLGNAPTVKPTIAEIKRAVCARKGLTLAEIESKCRKRRMAWPRQVAAALCRELTDASYPKIARHFGGRDHTTILWAVRKIKRTSEQNPELEITLGQLREQIMQAVAERPAPPPLPPVEPIPEPLKMWTPEPPKRDRKRGRKLTYYPRRVSVLEREAWEQLGGERENAPA